MGNRNLALLLGAAILVVGGAWYLSVQRDRATEASFATRPLLPGVSAKVNDVTALSVETVKGSFRIERAGEYWIMPDKAGYRVKADSVRKTILGVAGLEIIEPRTNKPELYDRIQVSEPKAYKPADEAAKADAGPMLVQLLDARNEALAKVIVGKVKVQELGGKPAEVHVRLPGQAESWLARGRISLIADPVQWLDRDMVKIERARVHAAAVRHPDGSLLRVERTDGADGTANDDFRPVGIPAGKKMASQYDVNALPGALAFITFDDVARAGAHDFSKATATVIETRDGLRVTIRSVPAADGKAWATLQVEYDGGLRRPEASAAPYLAEEEARKQADEAGMRLHGWAYLLSEYAARDLTRKLSDLIEDEKPKGDSKG